MKKENYASHHFLGSYSNDISFGPNNIPSYLLRGSHYCYAKVELAQTRADEPGTLVVAQTRADEPHFMSSLAPHSSNSAVVTASLNSSRLCVFLHTRFPLIQVFLSAFYSRMPSMFCSSLRLWVEVPTSWFSFGIKCRSVGNPQYLLMWISHQVSRRNSALAQCPPVDCPSPSCSVCWVIIGFPSPTRPSSVIVSPFRVRRKSKAL